MKMVIYCFSEPFFCGAQDVLKNISAVFVHTIKITGVQKLFGQRCFSFGFHRKKESHAGLDQNEGE